MRELGVKSAAKRDLAGVLTEAKVREMNDETLTICAGFGDDATGNGDGLTDLASEIFRVDNFWSDATTGKKYSGNESKQNRNIVSAMKSEQKSDESDNKQERDKLRKFNDKGGVHGKAESNASDEADDERIKSPRRVLTTQTLLAVLTVSRRSAEFLAQWRT